MKVGTPPFQENISLNGKVSLGWTEYLSNEHRILSAEVESGATAQRPTKNLWLGRRFYDETLNQIVIITSVSPVTWTALATGSSGEVNTASNVGTVSGWFKQKSGVDLQFKSAVAGSPRVTIVSNTNDLTFDVQTTAFIGGSGTTNTLPKFTASGVIGNSSVSDDGTTVITTNSARVNPDAQRAKPSGLFPGRQTFALSARCFSFGRYGFSKRSFAALTPPNSPSSRSPGWGFRSAPAP